MGDETINSVIMDVPLIKIAFPFSVCNVLVVGNSVIKTVPTQGVTNGGAVYGRGALSTGGNSSPSRQTNMLFTLKFVHEPISGTGARS